MKYRNPLAVFFLSLITFGIYSIVWQVKTKGEMNRQGATIPTAWLIIIPFVNWWWLWKYSEGVELVSKKELSTIISFILLFVLGIIGMAIIQNEFNKLAPETDLSVGGTPTPPTATTPPTAPMPPTAPPTTTPTQPVV